MKIKRMTDLAYERDRADTRIPGVEFTSERHGNTEIERLIISSEEGAKSIEKDMGRYTTLCFERIWRLNEDELEALSNQLSNVLLELCKPHFTKEGSVLVAGLGNRNITADAIGPQAVEKIIATRHLREHKPEIFKKNFSKSIAAVVPGVLGQTGIEAAEMIRAASRACDAEVIIAIDALASRSPERLASTIQLCDTGIVPGSGIGNCRAAINKGTIGVPVIAVGVPTVVNSAVLLYDALSKAGELANNDVIQRQTENLFVSPRESDTATEIFSTIIADAINSSFGIFSKEN